MPHHPLHFSPPFSPHQHPTPYSSSLPEPPPKTTSISRSLNPYELLQIDMWVGVGNIPYTLELSSMSLSTQPGYPINIYYPPGTLLSNFYCYFHFADEETKGERG